MVQLWILFGSFLKGSVNVLNREVLEIVIETQFLALTEVLYFFQNLNLFTHLFMVSLNGLLCTSLNLFKLFVDFLNLPLLLSNLFFLLFDYLFYCHLFILFALFFVFLKLFLHLLEDPFHLRFLVLNFLNDLRCHLLLFLQFIYLAVSFIDE